MICAEEVVAMDPEGDEMVIEEAEEGMLIVLNFIP